MFETQGGKCCYDAGLRAGCGVMIVTIVTVVTFVTGITSYIK